MKAPSAVTAELVPNDALDNRGWDKVHAWEETRHRDGIKEERWYYQAAVILWLHGNHWEVIADTADYNADDAVMVRKPTELIELSQLCFLGIHLTS